MPNTCYVNGCSNRGGRDKVAFHLIPKVITHQGEKTEKLSKSRRRGWIAAIGRKDEPGKYARVCSQHFISGRPTTLYDTSNPDWIPTLLLNGAPRKKCKSNTDSPSQKKLARFNRRKKRVALKVAQESTSNNCAVDQIVSSDEKGGREQVCNFMWKGSLEDMENSKYTTGEVLPQEAYEEEFQRLLSENRKLRGVINNLVISEDTFKDSDDRVKFMTGLPNYQMLMYVFDTAKEFIPHDTSSKLTKFQKLMLTLMKIRLGSSMQDLGYRFGGISVGTVSEIFKAVLHILYVRLKPLIFWPDSKALQLTMPLSFRENFGLKVVVIVDCFEIFIERPSNIMASAQTWSNHKHHNTVKFLIGIVPQGVICFLSNSWGGKATDTHIIENSGLLDKLQPQDVVLADRGFHVRDPIALTCAEVKFTKGKKQLSAYDVECMRKIAHSHIQVEKLIGLVKNEFSIMREILPIEFCNKDEDGVPPVDKIVTVCCALTNLCPSIVSFD